jgi:hypothetical protein
MAGLETNLEELESVKQSFKNKIKSKDISTENVEFRNYPSLLDQMERTSTKSSIVVFPSVEEQLITPALNTYFKQITVEPVTSEIDSNIKPENIREGVTILGQTGAYKGGEFSLQESNILGKWGTENSFIFQFVPNNLVFIDFGSAIGVDFTYANYSIVDSQIVIDMGDLIYIDYDSVNDELIVTNAQDFGLPERLDRIITNVKKEILGEWQYSTLTYVFNEDGTVKVINNNNETNGTYSVSGWFVDITYNSNTIRFIFNEIDDVLVDESTFEHVFARKTATLIEKEITTNGTYNASDDGATGYSSVVVNVASSGGGDGGDLDYIKYHDKMIQIETGKEVPTDEEYEQIINNGYKILDYVFRGVR